MRSILSISLALGALYQQTSAVAIPLEKRHEGLEHRWGRYGHRKGHGHGRVESTIATLPSKVAVSPNPTGTAYVTVPGTAAPTPTPEGDDDEGEGDGNSEDDSEDSPSTSTKEQAAVTTAASPTTTGSQASASASATAPATKAAGSIWKPVAGTTWQIQITDQVTDLDLPVDVYDLDLFDNMKTGVIQKLQTKGKKVICYFSAGSFEDWRPDASSFAEADKGNALDGWPGERWLNTNSPNVRKIMSARLDLAKEAGCDAVDPDNVDVYENGNGIGITFDNSVEYMKWMADEAHSRGMAVGLKNGADMVKPLLSSVEFQVNEQCVEVGECNMFVPFIKADKPVFHIEYADGTPLTNQNFIKKSCAQNSNNFSTVLKNMDLDAPVQLC